MHYANKFIDKDWCISRQLWWGQRIPAYKCYLKNKPNINKWFAGVSKEDAYQKACKHFNTKELEIEQDDDVFDTWFTSTILPLAAFGWKNNRDQLLKKFYPTNVLETGFDIMFFWAFRMVGMCYALSGKLPYNKILFHGLILDSEGRKMSKSIGNVIDPMDLINGASLKELKDRIAGSNLGTNEKLNSTKYQEKMYPKGIEAVGSDATRLALLVQDFKCDGVNIDINLFKDSKKYCNKIWQSVRYSQISVDTDAISQFKLKSLNEVAKFFDLKLIT
jgi:valyl-tRNA synthetase